MWNTCALSGRVWTAAVVTFTGTVGKQLERKSVRCQPSNPQRSHYHGSGPEPLILQRFPHIHCFPLLVLSSGDCCRIECLSYTHTPRCSVTLISCPFTLDGVTVTFALGVFYGVMVLFWEQLWVWSEGNNGNIRLLSETLGLLGTGLLRLRWMWKCVCVCVELVGVM